MQQPFLLCRLAAICTRLEYVVDYIKGAEPQLQDAAPTMHPIIRSRSLTMSNAEKAALTAARALAQENEFILRILPDVEYCRSNCISRRLCAGGRRDINIVIVRSS